MKTIQLSKDERKFLMQLYKNSSDRIEKANSLSLLLSHRGISEKQIAKMLKVAPDDVNLLVTLWKTTQEQEKYKFLHVDLLNHSMAYWEIQLQFCNRIHEGFETNRYATDIVLKQGKAKFAAEKNGSGIVLQPDCPKK